MEFSKTICQSNQAGADREWLPENMVEVERVYLGAVVKRICDTKECRYPLLSLRLLIHIMTSMDNYGRTHISARHLSKALDVHYDTVTKCLKYLRQIDAIQIER